MHKWVDTCGYVGYVDLPHRSPIFMKHANVDIGRWIEEHVLYKQRISLRWIGGEFNQIVGLRCIDAFGYY